MKKRITSILVALSMLLSVMPVFSLSASAIYSGGDGTANNPYLISNETDLTNFALDIDSNAISRSCYVELANDIALSNPCNLIYDFQGTFDGKNHKITGINITHGGSSVSFFRQLSGNAVVKNLHLYGDVANTSGLSTNFTAGFVGKMFGSASLYNCSFDGTVSGGYVLGGLVGEAYPDVGATMIISNCWVSADINRGGTGKYAASICSEFGDTGNGGTLKISQCYANVNFDKNIDYRGYFLNDFSANMTAEVKNCYFSGTNGRYFVPRKKITGSLTMTNCHAYDTNGCEDFSSQNTGTLAINNCFQLTSSTASATWNGVERKDAAFFMTDTNFINAGWDFSSTGEWKQDSLYPILRSSFTSTEKDTTIKYYGNGDTTYDLKDYIYSMLDSNFSTVTGRFTYNISANETLPKRVWDISTYSYINEPGGTTETVAAITGANSDQLELNPDMPVGTYAVDVTVTNPAEGFIPYTIHFTIIKKAHIPAPQLNPTPSPAPTYNPGVASSPALTLDDLKLNDGWQWDDATIIPKNSDGNPDPYYIFTTKQGYKAFYMFDTPANDTIANAVNYYDWDDVDAYAATNNLTVSQVTSPSDGITVVYDPKVQNSDESPYVKYIRVKDADTGAILTGAMVTCEDKDPVATANPHYPDEFPMNATDTTWDVTRAGLTRNDGVTTDIFAYAELSPGSHKLKASMTGYDDNSVTAVVAKDSLTGEDDVIEILLSPSRGSLTLPQVYIKTRSGGSVSTTNNPVPNAYITITKVNTSDAPSWNGGAASLRGRAGIDTLAVPYDVPFELRSSTNGYSKDEIIYMMTTSAGGVKYYKDAGCTNEITVTADQALWAFPLGDPTYTAIIDDTATPGEYTVTVTLENIKATYGAFGLKYDTSVFKPIDPNPSGGKNSIPGGSSITLGSEIASLTTVETMYSDTWANTYGYYVFEWHADDASADELDTEAGAKVIAEFKFELINVADADAPSYSWFDIMKWGDTQAAINMVAGLPAGADDMIYEHWREVDGDNAPGAPAYARLESPKAVVNGTDTRGFFQAAVNEDLTDPTSFTFYDVKTVLDWQITVNNSILQFHMYDAAETTKDLPDAVVTLYDDPSGAYVDQKNAQPIGIARFAVNTVTGAHGPDFAYTVTCPGYWPIPVDGLVSSRPTVTAPTGVVTNVPVAMQKKIYHVPVVTNTGITSVGNHDLGGEKFAYNGRNFHFRAKAAKGYKITQYPTQATVKIWNDATLSYDVYNLTADATTGYFELYDIYLNQRTLQDLDANDPTKYSTLMTSETSTYGASVYDDVITGGAFSPTAQPDAEGFRSYNIYIEFVDFYTEEIPYLVEGVTNDPSKGTVTYIQDAGTLAEDAGGTSDYRKVTTLTSSDPNGPDRKTGTFRFEAAPGTNYKIEKVYINGIRSYGYEGETQLDYSFGEVDMNCNITVIFWDGVTPSDDKLITLVVGEYGFVQETAPDNDKLSDTRRVYLNKGDLQFSTGTDFPSVYEVNKVEQEIETVGTVTRTTLPSASSYTISGVAGENVIVYVTFRNKDAVPNTTPNVFVKSYVMQGKGKVTPAGVLIYCLSDTVDLTLDADQSNSSSPYTVKGVELQDFDTLAQTGTYDYPPPLNATENYRYLSLTGDIAIGAVFVEPTFAVTGTVNLAQGPPGINSNAVQSGATITFYKLDGSLNEISPQVPYTFTTTKSRTAAVFTANIPIGHWNVYVTKPGYLTYKITDFDMTSSTTLFGNGNAITPYIGSTVNGKSITLTDAANVKSGWRKGVNSIVYARADVDDDGSVSIEDLTYIWHNYNKRLVEQRYTDFCTNGSNAINKISP